MGLAAKLHGKEAQQLHRAGIIKQVDDPDFEAESRNMRIVDEIFDITNSQTDEEVAEYDWAEDSKEDERCPAEVGGTLYVAVELVIVVKLANCHGDGP